MPERLVLHIGSPKCGSTYLQRVLLRNNAALHARDITYPHDGTGHPGNGLAVEGVTREGLDALSQGAGTVVFSHEDLFAAAPRAKALAKLAADTGLSVQIVVFVRPFSEFIFGDYSQFMKQFFAQFLATRRPYDGRSFEDFALDRAKRLRPAQYLKAWQGLFPARPIIIASHRDIRPVIEPLLGGEGLDWRVPRDQANLSLRTEDCDRIARAMENRDIGENAIRQMLRDAFRAAGEPDAGRTAERVQMIETLFAPQNAALLRQFGFDNRLMDGVA